MALPETQRRLVGIPADYPAFSAFLSGLAQAKSMYRTPLHDKHWLIGATR
jgi:hypothetical protein